MGGTPVPLMQLARCVLLHLGAHVVQVDAGVRVLDAFVQPWLGCSCVEGKGGGALWGLEGAGRPRCGAQE